MWNIKETLCATNDTFTSFWNVKFISSCIDITIQCMRVYVCVCVCVCVCVTARCVQLVCAHSLVTVHSVQAFYLRTLVCLEHLELFVVTLILIVCFNYPPPCLEVPLDGSICLANDD